MSTRPKKPARAKRPSPEPKRPAKPHHEEAPARVEEPPRSHALAHRAASLALDKKATDVVILDMRGRATYADYLVIASGESERQVTSMAEHLEEKLADEGYRPIGTEGLESGHWVLLDFGEVVAHLFFAEVRAFYDLEGLWVDAPRELVA